MKNPVQLLLLFVCPALGAAFAVPTTKKRAGTSTVALQARSSRLEAVSVTAETGRRTKKMMKTKKKKKKFATTQKNAVSEQELADHVSNLYLYGQGGILREKSKSSSVQSDFMKKLNSHPTLVLNANYQPLSHLPLSLWTWQEAVKAVCIGKVQVLETYKDVVVRSTNWELQLPSVIVLNDYARTHRSAPAFTKRNVFLRDEYKCQYCDTRFYGSELTLDHVVPRSKGGTLNWKNAVACCKHCNGRKGNLHVNDLSRVGMKLNRHPFVPSEHQLAALAGKMLPRKTHPTWEAYLGNVKSSSRE